MRFMMIVKATPTSEAGQPPSAEDIAAMGRYNQQLADAGILLAMEGLALMEQLEADQKPRMPN